MLVRVKVERVTLDTATSRFVVILKDEKQNRWLPIVVGSTEAQAIALQLENIAPPRPLTHDLIRNLLELLDVNVVRVVVNDLRDNTYFALINLQCNGLSKEIDARPSDAIALALRMKAPIYIEEEVMRKAAIAEGATPIEETDDDLAPGDRLEQLNIDLINAVQEERYEEAARIRDEIKKVKSHLREKAT
ncbi:bifunctional nuclease family protein [candidate division KSB1 bacterium]|nr:bifunctional nuclease family protein [candidate division KSB1 bacterium]